MILVVFYQGVIFLERTLQMSKLDNIIGKKFGRLTVTKRAENKGKNVMWLCKCDCGNEIIVRGSSLKNGHTKSCGCLLKEKTSIKFSTHKKSKNRLYKIYYCIKQRCYNPKTTRFDHWGGRGVKICDEWKNSFDNFYLWAIKNGYKDNLSIDRINNDGNYEPSNCRWVTAKIQSRNRSSNIEITYNGETHCLKEWAEILDIDYKLLYDRYKLRGWNFEETIKLPLNSKIRYERKKQWLNQEIEE